MVFAFFFMQVDLFSKMYQKKILKIINMKWDIASLFIISAGGQSRKLSRLYLFHLYFSCLLFVSFFSLCLVFRGMVLFMSCHLHAPAESTCTTYNKWRFHNIKCVEAVLVVLSVTVCRKDPGSCELRDNGKEWV